MIGCAAPNTPLEMADCVIAAQSAKTEGRDFNQTMKVCRVDSDCAVFFGVCRPDAVNKRFETCAIWQAREQGKVVKCAAYSGDITKVSTTCDAGVCVAHDPWTQSY